MTSVALVSTFSPEPDNKHGPTSLLLSMGECLQAGGMNVIHLRAEIPNGAIKRKLYQLGLRRGSDVNPPADTELVVYPYWTLGNLPSEYQRRAIVVAPDLQSLLFRRRANGASGVMRFAYGLVSNILRIWERKLLANAKRVLFVGEADAVEYFVSNSRNGRYAPHPITSVMRASIIEQVKPRSKARLMLLSGAGGPSYFGTFAEDVLRQLSAHQYSGSFRVLLLGKDKLPLFERYRELLPGLAHREWIEDYRTLFQENSVIQLVPLTVGAGTKNRVLEAIALGAAVVTTSVGAENCADFGECGLIRIADEPGEFARILAYLWDHGWERPSQRQLQELFDRRLTRFRQELLSAIE